MPEINILYLISYIIISYIFRYDATHFNFGCVTAVFHQHSEPIFICWTAQFHHQCRLVLLTSFKPPVFQNSTDGRPAILQQVIIH